MKNVFSILFLLLTVGFLHGQEVLGEVEKAIEEGDAAVLSAHFNNPVSIKIENKEEIYSADQARVVLRQFFTDHPPVSFEENHHGEGVDGHFVIGTYRCSHKESFKIYFLLKDNKGTSKVFQFFIEEE